MCLPADPITNPIINPKLGSIATGTLDYSNGDVALKIVGSDFVTWDAINIIEPAGLSSVALTEYGIAILQATATNGCKNICCGLTRTRREDCCVSRGATL